jgi:putative DNA primase/helicase
VSRLDEEAEREERDLRIVKDTLAGKRRTRERAAAKAKAEGPRARFASITVGDRPGVYWIDARSEGGEAIECEPVFVCTPLAVTALTRDAHSEEWGRLLVFHDRDGKEHRWAMPMRMLAGSGEELRGELLRQGLEITSHPKRRGYVSDFIQWANPEARARCVLRTGWHGSTFVLPSETFGSSAEPILFQGNSTDNVSLGCAGTLDGWRDEVCAPCAGNSRLVLALSAAFAGPCLGLLDAEGGGLHFRGGSSTGKSTALALAASVFGEREYMRTWRATDNALEGVAATHSDLLLVLDEIGQLDPKHAGSAAYLLANGQGKSRSNRDGSARAPVKFRLLFISAGEVGLSDLVTSAGAKARAGQEIRVLDVPAEPFGGEYGIFDSVPVGCTPGEFADRLKHAASMHHGHPLRAWLGYLTSDTAAVRDAMRKFRDDMTDSLAGAGAVGQVRRAAAKFALIASAGEVATLKKLTGWPQGAAASAARACFADWLRARGTKGNAEPAAMLAQVRLYLAQHGEARFSPWDRVNDERAPRTVNRAGWRRSKDDPTDSAAYYIAAEVFRSEVCSGFDPAQVARALADSGALRMGSNGEYTRKIRVPDGTTPRVYVVLPSVFGDENEDDASSQSSAS